MIKRYNIIGDIHGRTCWKGLVRDDAVNIFLGDYLDPYDEDKIKVGVDDLANLKEIVRFKKAHPETILLLGNHDWHYLFNEHYSRYNERFSSVFSDFFKNNWNFFTMACSIENAMLVTHAGVTRPWLDMVGLQECQAPDEIAENINHLVLEQYGFVWLTASRTFRKGDWMGESDTASPIWVRPRALLTHNAVPDGFQIVGHTQMSCIETRNNVYFVDCLGTNPSSLLVTINDNNEVEFEINDFAL